MVPHICSSRPAQLALCCYKMGFRRVLLLAFPNTPWSCFDTAVVLSRSWNCSCCRLVRPCASRVLHPLLWVWLALLLLTLRWVVSVVALVHQPPHHVGLCATPMSVAYTADMWQVQMHGRKYT